MEFPIFAKGSATFDAVGFGHNTIDMVAQVEPYPPPDSKQQLRAFVESPGGEAATAMVACARLGWRSRYVGRFGNDDFGRKARLSLEQDHVDLSACENVSASHPFALILVDEEGNRTILSEPPRRVPAFCIGPDEVDLKAVTSGRVLLVDCHQTAGAAKAASYARRAGIPTIMDVDKVRPGIESLLEQIDMIVTSQSFPEAFTGLSGVGCALGAIARRFNPAMVCATLGDDGSLAILGERELRTRAFGVPVVDTTGAGDVFRGGLIAGWLGLGSRPQVEDVLAYANAVAALSCRALGARAGIPRIEEVERLLASSNL